MTQVNLRVYQSPGQAEVFLRIARKDAGFLTHTGIVDTGAQTSLFPETWLDDIDYRLSERGEVWVAQAGIAGQEFKAIEAHVKVVIEDLNGKQSPELETLVWFTKTRRVLIGFDGILEQAVFHLNMPRLTGYLQFGEDED